MPASVETPRASGCGRHRERRLEDELSTQLHRARIAHAGHKSISTKSCDVKAECCEVRMVEDIKDLPTQLDTTRLAETNVLRQRRVESSR